jgi:uncharacterized protein
MVSKEIERTQYLNELDIFRDKTDVVKVITGVRRCGKSTMLSQYIHKLIVSGVPNENIIRMNLESAEYFGITNYKDLTERIYSKIPKKGRCYVFLDEIQRVEGWERTVNAMIVDLDADIYITGSNSNLLSSELSTFLTGRFTSVNMLPLSFKEFQSLHSDSGRNDRDLFDLFMTYGGFPGADPTEEDVFTRTYLQDLYSSILYWDVMMRDEIRSTEELDRFVQYMMINIGNPVSIKGIVDGMGNIHRKTAEKYLGYTRQAFLLYRADRYDLKGTSLNPTPKYYAVDQGLRNMSLDFDISDTGRVLENIVYLELVRRRYRVQVGKWDSKEIDFVATRTIEGREYIQVCYDINMEETRKRELAPLECIKDSFPKTVLVVYPGTSTVTKEGIRIKNIIEWLLE